MFSLKIIFYFICPLLIIQSYGWSDVPNIPANSWLDDDDDRRYTNSKIINRIIQKCNTLECATDSCWGFYAEREFYSACVDLVTSNFIDSEPSSIDPNLITKSNVDSADNSPTIDNNNSTIPNTSNTPKKSTAFVDFLKSLEIYHYILASLVFIKICVSWCYRKVLYKYVCCNGCSCCKRQNKESCFKSCFRRKSDSNVAVTSYQRKEFQSLYGSV